MATVCQTNEVGIQYFVDDLDMGARTQAEACAKLPHAFHHIAIMPDAHQGFAMPVGGVMALKGAIMPNAVGVDIGCGMLALRTNLKAADTEPHLDSIADTILHTIPLGFHKHETPQQSQFLNQTLFSESKGQSRPLHVARQHQEEIPFQLGTLGGGNHFIELQHDQDGILWVMIHSGSRNVGLKIASFYHKVAQEYCESTHQLTHKDYAYLPLEVPEAQDYVHEMEWAIGFAEQNRIHMMNHVLSVIRQVSGDDIVPELEVHTRHNYAALEEHFGEQVWVHRKGAVRARSGELVTIPGSMGTCSFIGRGKGYAESFESCSHGAGRRKGRMQARKEIDAAELKRQVRNVVIATPSLNKIVDEAPAVYKNIEDVMDKQKCMVDIVYRLLPMAVVKG